MVLSTPPFSAEVKEGVELYLYSTSGPSWAVTGWLLLLPLPLPFLPKKKKKVYEITMLSKCVLPYFNFWTSWLIFMKQLRWPSDSFSLQKLHFDPRQFMWKWHRDRFFCQYTSFPLSVPMNLCCIHSIIHQSQMLYSLSIW